MGTKSARKIFSENLQRLMRNKNVDQKELAEAIELLNQQFPIGLKK